MSIVYVRYIWFMFCIILYMYVVVVVVCLLLITCVVAVLRFELFNNYSFYDYHYYPKKNLKK